jgi:hypothetical protein
MKASAVEAKDKHIESSIIFSDPFDYSKFFEQWKTDLENHLSQSLPELDDGAKVAFVAECSAVESADVVRKNAEKLRDAIYNQKPVDEEEINLANQTVELARKAFQDAMDACEKVAVDTILDRGLDNVINDPNWDDTDLVTYTVICQGGVKPLAQWCEHGEVEAQELISAIQDTALMRTFLESGGPRKGKYGKAVQLYNSIQPEDPVLKRLALAVSLELADPYPLFRNEKEHTDAFSRYVHYEQAYLLGELDPLFSQFNIFELRNVVNSDATDDELSWGRRCLLNYRPDLVDSKDPQWQYCKLVRTDVSYNRPDWYKSPRSYDQILSGGGQCGPRAWFGRFICKAFGIPTWGARQVSHVEISRKH